MTKRTSQSKRKRATAPPSPKRTRVTLIFRTEFARDYFMGQLSDGWGENICDLDWPSSRSFKYCDVFDVKVFSPKGVGEVLAKEDVR